MSCGCQHTHKQKARTDRQKVISKQNHYSSELEETQIRYKITQLSDNGISITLSLIEDIELEAISQQQIMLEAIDRSISDEEVKKQIKPVLEAILRSQPQTVIKTYPKTVIQINMSRKKYENIGSPGVGNKILVDIKRDSTQV
jgi:hypothetical protein